MGICKLISARCDARGCKAIIPDLSYLGKREIIKEIREQGWFYKGGITLCSKCRASLSVDELKELGVI